LAKDIKKANQNGFFVRAGSVFLAKLPLNFFECCTDEVKSLKQGWLRLPRQSSALKILKTKKCSSELGIFSFLSTYGDPGRVRTCNHQSRNLIFYPVELRSLKKEDRK
jgi:hypothetical protein